MDANKKKKLEDHSSSFTTNPVSFVVPDCFDLILQHFKWYEILTLSLVSTSWARTVNDSSAAMKKITFVLWPESSTRLQKSTRRYQSIRVCHDDIEIQRANFLSSILTSLQWLRSLSFNGTFGQLCIDDFFNKLERNSQNLHVHHLTFYGNNSNIDLLLKRFTALKIYRSITLIAFEKETFINLLNLLRAEKLFLIGMKIKKLNLTGLSQNDCVTELHLSRTKIDTISIEGLLKMLNRLKILNIADWEAINYVSKRKLVEMCSPLRLEMRIISTPPADYFLLSSTPNIHNLILQHLSGEELLNVSIVSKAWFNLSKGKISKDLQFNLLSTKITSRSYENVSTTMTENLSSVVKLSHYTSNLRELNLELEPRSITNLIFLLSNHSFNNLTLLNVSCHESSLLDNLKLPTTLKILHLSNFHLGSPDLSSAFFQFLSEAKALEDLQFSDSRGLEKLFTTNVARRTQFKLRSLKLIVDEAIPEVSQNFRSFLKIQARTLEVLIINEIHADTIEHLAENSCITSLDVQSLHISPEGLEFLKALDFLKELKVPTIENFEDVKVLLKLAPNVEKVYLFRLSETCLNFLQTFMTHLREIQFTRRQKLIPNISDIKMGIKLRRNSFYGDNFSC